MYDPSDNLHESTKRKSNEESDSEDEVQKISKPKSSKNKKSPLEDSTDDEMINTTFNIAKGQCNCVNFLIPFHYLGLIFGLFFS